MVILLNSRVLKGVICITSVLTVREDQEVKQQRVGSGRLQDEIQARYIHISYNITNMAVIGVCSLMSLSWEAKCDS